MRRFNYKKYLFFGLLVLVVVSLPAAFVQAVRAKCIRVLFPFWKTADKFFGKNADEQLAKLHRLEIENHLLRIEMGKLASELEKKTTLDSLEKELTSETKRQKELQTLIKSTSSSVPPTVIYRDPGTWGNAFWINIGEEHNRKLGRKMIRKNSPVLYGRSIVGAIEYVGKTQSKVKLITDAAIKPSVRVARGRPQNIYLQESLETCLRHLKARSDLASTSQSLVNELKTFRDKISADSESWYLAKGILQGSKTPFCRGLSLLWGVGFNYDFDDQEGGARDLLQGKSKDGSKTIPILKKGDLLVTTGMDGIFPPGLRVAEVTNILPLREGSYTYEIEATPTCGNLDDLTSVFVIAPLGFDSDEKESGPLLFRNY